jgi:hypothetical protein
MGRSRRPKRLTPASRVTRRLCACIARLRWLYSRRQFATMLVALAIGTGAVWHANRLLTVHDPPPLSTEPVLAVMLDALRPIQWLGRAEYQVREAFSGCRNPVTVEFDALVHPRAPVTDRRALAQHGFVHGVLIDPLSAVRSVAIFENPSSTFPPRWKVPRGIVRRRTEQDLLFGAPLRRWYPASMSPGMHRHIVRAVLVKARFRADWVLPRSEGTCFVRFPTLQVPSVDPLLPPGDAVYPPARGPGAVSVVSVSGETVDVQASIPPPTDPRIPQWECRTMSDGSSPATGSANCGGVAVFSEPGSDAHVALWLLIDGALIGLAAALLVEPAVRFRWPLAPTGRAEGDANANGPRVDP